MTSSSSLLGISSTEETESMTTTASSADAEAEETISSSSTATTTTTSTIHNHHHNDNHNNTSTTEWSLSEPPIIPKDAKFPHSATSCQFTPEQRNVIYYAMREPQVNMSDYLLVVGQGGDTAKEMGIGGLQYGHEEESRGSGAIDTDHTASGTHTASPPPPAPHCNNNDSRDESPQFVPIITKSEKRPYWDSFWNRFGHVGSFNGMHKETTSTATTTTTTTTTTADTAPHGEHASNNESTIQTTSEAPFSIIYEPLLKSRDPSRHHNDDSSSTSSHCSSSLASLQQQNSASQSCSFTDVDFSTSETLVLLHPMSEHGCLCSVSRCTQHSFSRSTLPRLSPSFPGSVPYLPEPTEIPDPVNNPLYIQLFDPFKALTFTLYKNCPTHMGALLEYAVALYNKYLHKPAFPIFQILAEELNMPHSLYYFAVMLESGRGCTKNPEKAKIFSSKAFETLRAQAESKNASAYLNYARLLDFGFGTVVDLKRAAHWYQRAVDETKSPIAYYNLSLMYQEGEGVPRDEEKARTLSEQAAKMNYPDAQYHCGNTAVRAGNVEMACYWYKAAIKCGSTPAINSYASLFYEGNMVEKDLKFAIRLWKIAVERGNSAASFNCAYRYLDGVGLSADYCNSLKLFTINMEEEKKRMQEIHHYNALHSTWVTQQQSLTEETISQTRNVREVLVQMIIAQRKEYLSNGKIPTNRSGRVLYSQLANEFFHGYASSVDMPLARSLFEKSALYEKRKKALWYLLIIHYYLNEHTVKFSSLKHARFYLNKLKEVKYRQDVLMQIESEMDFREQLLKSKRGGIFTDVNIEFCE